MIAADLAVNAALGAGLAGALATAAVQWRGRRSAENNARTTAAAAKEAEHRAAIGIGELRRACDAQHRNAEDAARWYQGAAEEAEHLWKVRLPALVDAEIHRYPGVVVPGMLNPGLEGTEFETMHEKVAKLLLETVEQSRTGVARSARAGVRGIAVEAQTHLARLQQTIDTELGKHPDATEYYASLFEIDRIATPAKHALQRLLVLAGSWPGLRWADAPLREVVESARGRIRPYDRVTYNYQPDTGEQFIEGRVVEPLAIALAELMANAADCSSQPVSVYLVKETKGFQIVVEDGGGGMNTFQREAAERILSRRTVLDVTLLEDERKLGFPVVSLLCHDFGFRADVSAPSIRGGVRAALFVPSHLLTTATKNKAEVAESNPADTAPELPLPEDPAPWSGPDAGDVSPSPGATTVSGLPKRRRVLRPEPRPQEPGQESLTDTHDPQAVQAGFENLRQSLRDGYNATEER
ncbi:ATP-binding protein [Streptomyces niveus]|uniref:ATP-binding protein n=1 Tax=Streptomyces niveus TaxID=193462 RepID=UPI00368EDBFC